jgi:uncharacterized membrane protein YhaH (DUF805 family)
LAVLKKYVDFGGRARRSEYWGFALVSLVISIVLTIIDVAVMGMDYGKSIGILSSIYSIAVLLPSLGVLVRRLHDTGHSGWWWLIGLIPLVGALVILLFLVTDSQPGPNMYGPNPKETAPVTAS